MMSKLADEIRQRGAAAKASPPKAASQPAKPAAAPAAKSTPPTVGYEPVGCTCGHVDQLPLYADNNDKHREARRKKLAEKACSNCRQKANSEREREISERKAARKKIPQQVSQKRPPGRLPHASTFHVVYDAGSEKWAGTLIVDGQTFEATASAVFKLLTKLDDAYRAAAVPNG